MKDQKFPLRPASREEAGLFYSNDERDEVLGTVGHLRMDFGSGGKGFHHTWWPHNEDRFNTPEFKEALQEFVDAMRQSGPLKNLAAIAGTTEVRSQKTTASTGLLRRQNVTDFACGVPQDQGIIKGICIATTYASRRWPDRRNWWAE